MTTRLRLIASSVALLTTVATLDAIGQCAQRIAMSSYSVCLPVGLRAERNDSVDGITLCDTPKHCATTWGAAPSGLAFLIVRPAEGVYQHAHYSGPEEIVAAMPLAGLPPPHIIQVVMPQETSGLKRRCFLARRLMPALGAWDEVYGLEVNNHLFWAWTHYEDDPNKIEGYRAAIVSILSSVTPN